jgi:hypothetical protein
MTEKDYQNEEREQEPKPDTKKSRRKWAHTILAQMA